MLPVRNCKLLFVVEGACSLASALRENKLSTITEIIHSFVVQRSRSSVQRLEPLLLSNHCQFTI